MEQERHVGALPLAEALGIKSALQHGDMTTLDRDDQQGAQWTDMACGL